MVIEPQSGDTVWNLDSGVEMQVERRDLDTDGSVVFWCVWPIFDNGDQPLYRRSFRAFEIAVMKGERNGQTLHAGTLHGPPIPFPYPGTGPDRVAALVRSLDNVLESFGATESIRDELAQLGAIAAPRQHPMPSRRPAAAADMAYLVRGAASLAATPVREISDTVLDNMLAHGWTPLQVREVIADYRKLTRSK